MTQVREALTIVDGGPPSLTFSKSKKGHHISRSLAILLAAIYVISIVATGLLVYNFAKCPTYDLTPEYSIKCDNKSYIEDSITNIPFTDNNPNGNDSNAEDDAMKSNVRLPRNVTPLKYSIKLVPFIFEGNFTYNGEINITVLINEENDNITLHATELNIFSTEVLPLNDSHPEKYEKIIGHSVDAEKQFHTIHLKNQLVKDNYYSINMKFIGKLNDNLHGFYRSSYLVNNTTRWIATTQFQPTDARRAFPCFDEPALKARFSISIAHPKNMTAISNMDSLGQYDEVEGLPEYVWDHFRESLPMSTYLVAFVVSDFSKKSVGNFTVWARSDAIETAKYALAIGPKILKYFEQFYQIEFPLPKMDMIALPDFNAGAMENWGLMTFRETAMLYDEEVSARINKPRVATVVAHELAHQWFGNLVTPSWWSDLWLNEGFASYVEYVGVDAVEESWKSMDQFVIHEVQNVFSLDALTSSHQISVEVGNPDEINEIFDRISYGKGAAIIRMMDHFLTSPVFNQGITNYLKLKRFQSAEQNDLWTALTEQARADKVFDDSMSVKEVMDTWTLQTGFPVVNVRRDYETDAMHLQQERFVLVTNESQRNSDNKKTDGPLWWIPITYTSRTDADFESTKPVEWMRGAKDLQMSDTNVSFNDWIIFNINQTGFYRVNYDDNNWRLIIAHLNDPEHFEEISSPNRAQILDDALNLALGGRLSYSIALDVTRYLVHEREFVPWKAGLGALGYIDGMLAKGPHYLEYKKYILSLIDGLYKEVGFTDKPEDPMLTIYKRIDVINIACLLEHSDCISHAVTYFHNWMISPNPDTYNPYLDHSCRNTSGIRKQDVFRVFGAVSNSVIGQPIAFTFIRQNWARLKHYLGSSASNLNTIVKYSARKLNAQHELDELKKFSSERKGELGRTIDQAIEKTEANIV